VFEGVGYFGCNEKVLNEYVFLQKICGVW
jgi:hypothetical protein